MITKNTANGLRIFLILVVITITLILVFTVTEETVSALKKIKWIYLFSSIILLHAYILLEATRIELLSKTISGHFIRFSSSVPFIFCGAFLSAVTPFQAGGAPVQMYILKKEGMEWDKILTLLLMKEILYIFSALLLSIIFIRDFLSSIPYSIGMLSWYAVITYGVIFGFLIILLLKPVALKRFFFRISMPRGRRTRLTYILLPVSRVIHGMVKTFKTMWSDKPLHIIGLIFFTSLVYLPDHSIAYMILRGLNQHLPYASVILKQIFLLMAGFFFPTPGAEGMMEGGFLLLFRGGIPQHIIGIFTILWRFVTYYVVVIAGGIATLFLFGKRED